MINQQLDEAVIKAIKATNLCTLHMEYHGQKTKKCTPQERTLVKIKPKEQGGTE